MKTEREKENEEEKDMKKKLNRKDWKETSTTK